MNKSMDMDDIHYFIMALKPLVCKIDKIGVILHKAHSHVEVSLLLNSEGFYIKESTDINPEKNVFFMHSGNWTKNSE